MPTIRTKWFFDRPAVIKAIGAARADFLQRAGNYVRNSARWSLRRRKSVSAPGSPPSVHSDDPVATLKNIQYGYDPVTETEVIGPLALNVKRLLGPGGTSGNAVGPPRLQAGVVNQVMEYGGKEGIREVQIQETGKWERRPWNYKMGVRKIPIWKATQKQAYGMGRVLSFVRRGKRVVTYVEVNEAKSQRIRWATYAPRPFMGPALDKSSPEFPAMWANSIKKAAI